MSKIQPLYRLLSFNELTFSKKDLLFLEALLFIEICDKLKERIRENYQIYFQAMKYNQEEENIMLEKKFISCIIQDILGSGEYDLDGIAYYTDTTQDIIYELASGLNKNPTFSLSRRIIELHRSVRPDLYDDIIGRIR